MGHQVYNTDIRCSFSPVETTGQRYLYTGSANGCVMVFDTKTGDTIMTLHSEKSKGTTVKEVSWHPRDPVIASTTLTGVLNLWTLHHQYSNDIFGFRS